MWVKFGRILYSNPMEVDKKFLVVKSLKFVLQYLRQYCLDEEHSLFVEAFIQRLLLYLNAEMILQIRDHKRQTAGFYAGDAIKQQIKKYRRLQLGGPLAETGGNCQLMQMRTTQNLPDLLCI